jgi:hypothetical protein
MNESTDHDVLVTLVANVSNLKESQDIFHREMKESIRELGSNYSLKITVHENRINELETANTRQNVMLTIGISLLTLITGLLIYHLVGKPI